MPTTELAYVGLQNQDGAWGQVSLECDWNTNNRRVTALRCRSTMDREVVALLRSPLIPGGSYSVVVGPLATVTRTIPNNAGLLWGVPPNDAENGDGIYDSAGNPAPYGFYGSL